VWTRRGCLWSIVKPLLLLFIAGVLYSVAAFPWAIPLPGRDRLDGSWIGELRSNRGPEAWLLLSLEPHRFYEPRWGVLGGGGTPVGGTAVLCTANRRIEMDVSGDTTTWSGKTFDVLLQPVKPSPPQLRLQVEGTWDGHVVEFTQRNVSLADILTNDARDMGTEPESSKFISAQLRRRAATEFDVACSALKR
jgi:hypothetical protein